MGLEFRYGRDGTRRKTWYGSYTKADGTRTSVNLEIPIEGKPDASIKPTDSGNLAFERSKAAAKAQLDALQAQSKRGRIDKASAFRLYQEKTGAAIKQTRIEDLPSLLKLRPRTSPDWAEYKVKSVDRFVAWALRKGIKLALDVTNEVAQEYLNEMYSDGQKLSAKTVLRAKPMLGEVFDTALPEGAPNPWRTRNVTIHAVDGDREYHRTPLNPTEIESLLEASKEDQMLHDLIVCSLSTGLRRGDCCRLKWEGVNLKENSLRLTTSKTRTDLYLPILPLFKTVLEGRLAERKDGAVYVFPEAERMLRENPYGITWRIKKAFAMSFIDPEEDASDVTGSPKRIDPSLALPKVTEALARASIAETKRSKITDILTRYAGGQSYRHIEAETGISRGQISDYLHEAEKLSGILFLPNHKKTFSAKRAIADVTRQAREIGKRNMSKYDFHGLRTTFVTLAISNGFSIDKLKALTGHRTVEIVLKNYFRPKGSDFSSELTKAMPKSLTTLDEPKQIEQDQPSNRLETIAAAVGELSDDEKKQLKKMLSKKGGQ